MFLPESRSNPLRMALPIAWSFIFNDQSHKYVYSELNPLVLSPGMSAWAIACPPGKHGHSEEQVLRMALSSFVF